LPTENAQVIYPKKKMKLSNTEASKAPIPMRRVIPITPEFKAAHPDLWQAGYSGIAGFIRVVGRGLWKDEAMNASRWRAHQTSPANREERK
jgi:hypothetical protein